MTGMQQDQREPLPSSFPPKGRYRHFKGGEYLLIDFARDSETQEWMAVYRALYGGQALWVRPLSMWLEPVERDGVLYPHRFTYMDDFSANAGKKELDVSIASPHAEQSKSY